MGGKGDMDASIEEKGGGSRRYSMNLAVFRVLRASGNGKLDQNLLLSWAKTGTQLLAEMSKIDH